jgi:hypothetical protein
MTKNISYNLLLGHPWIHEMCGVPSTLHHKMKYVYENQVYKVDIDPKLESFLQVSKGIGSPLNTLIPTLNI